MHKNSLLTVALACVAGFVGGSVSQSLFSPKPVHAQVQIEPPAPHDQLPGPLPRPSRRPIPGEIEAHRFVLVDNDGNVFGIMTMNGDRPEIDLYDKTGKIIWKAPGSVGISPLSFNR